MKKIIATLLILFVAASGEARTVDENGFAKIATIGISPTQFPAGLTIRSGGGSAFGLIGALVDSRDQSDPSKPIASVDSMQLNKVLREQIIAQGYELSEVSADATLSVSLIEYGYAAMGWVFPYKPQITADVKVVARDGKVILEDYIAIGNNLYAGRWSGPRIVGDGSVSFSSKDDLDKSLDKAKLALLDTLPAFAKGIRLPPARVRAAPSAVKAADTLQIGAPADSQAESKQSSSPSDVSSLNMKPETPSIQQPVRATESPKPQPLVATPPIPVSTSPPPGNSPDAESPTARRLRELNALRKDGLINEREYNEKRKAILSEM